MEEAGDRVTGFMKSEGRLPNYVSCMCYDTLEVDHNMYIKM